MLFFSDLFNSNKKSGLTKIEFWAKFELTKLIEDLRIAQQLIEQNRDAIETREFKKFASEFDEELFDVSHDNVPDFTQTWKWFKQGGEWDQLLKNIDNDLRERIYFRADKWKSNN